MAWPVFSGSSPSGADASKAGSSKSTYSMEAVYFRPEKFKTKSDCLTAAYRQALPLGVCR
jgi:hypothetical protein